MKPVLIAQLTDTHIRADRAFAYGHVDTARFLEAAVAHLNALDPVPDAIVLTGDLVDYGSDAEYALVSALLAPLKAPLWVIPGNHDTANIWNWYPDCGARRPGNGLGYVADAGPVRLLMFDSTVAGEGGGHATPERCAWLAGALREAEGQPTLLFMHHPPFETGIAHMDAAMCRGAAQLASVVAGSGLLAIGCGHVHRSITATVGGVRTVIAPSPAHAVTLGLNPGDPSTYSMEPPGVLLHRIAGTAEAPTHVTHVSFIGGFGPARPFFQSDGSLV